MNNNLLSKRSGLILIVLAALIILVAHEGYVTAAVATAVAVVLSLGFLYISPRLDQVIHKGKNASTGDYPATFDPDDTKQTGRLQISKSGFDWTPSKMAKIEAMHWEWSTISNLSLHNIESGIFPVCRIDMQIKSEIVGLLLTAKIDKVQQVLNLARS